jgi:hypothetical protein
MQSKHLIFASPRVRLANVDDTWARRDLPVLDAIVSVFDKPDRYQMRMPELVGLCRLPEGEVQAALRVLANATPPYISGTEVSGLTYPVIITDVTERARRAVGQWPTPESLVNQVVNGLSEAAAHEPEPGKKWALREAASVLGDTAKDVATEIAAKIIVHAGGMG